MARTLRVTTLHISPEVAAKIQNRPGRELDPNAIRAQIEDVGDLPFRWDHDPKRGSRALVVTVIDDEAVRVVLYPSRSGDPEEWHLGRAYPDESQE
jgi:hypothetical protein